MNSSSKSWRLMNTICLQSPRISDLPMDMLNTLGHLQRTGYAVANEYGYLVATPKGRAAWKLAKEVA